MNDASTVEFDDLQGLLRFGYGAIPGSSSRGGAAGLRKLLAHVKCLARERGGIL